MFSKNSSLDESTSVIEFINSEEKVINLEQNGDITTAEIDNEVMEMLKVARDKYAAEELVKLY